MDHQNDYVIVETINLQRFKVDRLGHIENVGKANTHIPGSWLLKRLVSSNGRTKLTLKQIFDKAKADQFVTFTSHRKTSDDYVLRSKNRSAKLFFLDCNNGITSQWSDGIGRIEYYGPIDPED